MNNNIKEEIRNETTRYLRSRSALLLMIILSVINVFVIFFSGGKSDMIMPFSCGIATYSATIGTNIYINDGNTLFLIIGYLIAILLIAVLTVCFIKSKSNIVYLSSALAITIVDAIAIIILSISGLGISFSNSSTNFITHILLIWYLFVGIKSYKLLGDFKKYPENSSLEENKDTNTQRITIIEPTNHNDDSESLDSVLSGRYNNHIIHVTLDNNYFCLLIDGTLQDSIEIAHNSEFELNCIVDDVEISFQYRRSYDGESAYLYAGNALLDSYFTDNL